MVLSVTGNVMTITLDNDYLYPTTGGNLLVQFQQTTGGNYTSCTFLGIAASTMGRSFYSSNTDVNRTILPKLSFIYSNPSSCPRPTALTLDTVTSSEMTLSWTAGGSETSWLIGVNGTEQVVSTNPYTITNLNSNTLYSVSVRGLCGSGDTSSLTSASYRTSCDTIQMVPFSEDFENYASSTVPFCWTVLESYYSYPYVVANSSWSTYAHNGTKALQMSVYDDEGTTSQNTISLPAMSNVGGLMVAFWSKQGYDAPDVFSIGVIENDTTFVPYDTIALSDNYTYHTVYLNNYTGNGNKIAFHAQITGYYESADVYIDDIAVTTIPTCITPQDVIDSNATISSIDLAWTEMGTATAWNVAHDTVPITDFSNVTTSSFSALPATISGLDSNTSYYFYVQADCGSGDVSPWTFAHVAATSRCSDMCNIVVLATDSYGDGWNGNAINVVQGGRQVGSITLASGLSDTLAFPICPNDTVQFVWSQGSYSSEVSFVVNDAYGNELYTCTSGSSLTNGATFLRYATDCQPPQCARPMNVTFNSATTSTITFGWNEMGTATSWRVVYDTMPITNTSLYTPIQVASNPYTLTNLDSNTTYYIYVQADCGNVYSDWANVLTASTTRCDNNCNVVMHLTSDYSYPWNYSSVNFVQGGNVVATAGTSSSSSSTTQIINVCSGEPVQLIWNNTYPTWDYSDECAFTLTDAYDVELYTLQAGNTHGAGDTIYTFTTNCVAPTCVRPKNITFSGITANSAMVHWFDTMATSWTVQYGLAGFTYGTGTSVTASADSIALTGLLGGTNYDVYVTASCTDTTITSHVAHFTTSCVTITSYPYTETFENYANNGIPTCWTVYQSYSPNPCVHVNPLCAHNSNASLSVYMYTYGNTVNNTIALPHASGLQALQVSFYAYQEAANTADVFSVGVMDSTGTFVPVDTITLTPTYNNYTVYFNNYSGSGDEIAFHAQKGLTSGQVHIYIDDVVVDSIAACPAPNQLAIPSVGASSITLTWNEPGTATNWQVSYDTMATFNPLNGTIVNVSTNPTVTLNNLQGGSNYRFYVRSICGAGDSSLWSGPIAGMPNVWNMIANQTDTIYMCGGHVYDDGGMNGNYSASQTSILTIYPDTTSNTPHVLNLTGTVTIDGYTFDKLFVYDGVGTTGTQLVAIQGQSYTAGTTINVTSISGPLTIEFITDGSGQYSGFDLAVNCMSNSCPVPVNLHTTAANTTSLIVDWTDQSTPTSWIVEYGPTGFTQGTTAGTTMAVAAHPVTISNLAPLTAYDFYVRPICTGSDTGSWALPATFSTALCDGATIASTGSGTATTNFAPCYTYYHYSLSEVIIDSAEMATIGGEVTAFEFEALGSDAGTFMDSCFVYLANTTKSVFNSSSDFVNADSTFTRVYAGSLNYTTGWNTFSFDTNFTWDGHSNVIMIIDRNDGDYESPDGFAATALTSYKTIYTYEDYTDFDPTNIIPASYGVGYSMTRPNYHLISCGASSCPTPIVLSENHDYGQITVSWGDNGDSYEVEIKAATTAVWPAETAVSAHTYTFTGLTPATTYQYRIRHNCDTNGYSDWNTGTFTTDSLPCLVPTNLTASGMGTSAEFNWTPGMDETMWQLNVYNSTFNQIYTTSAHPYTVTGLISSVTYNAKVRAICGNGADTSDWSTPITFSTEACDAVTNVTASSLQSNSVAITWTPGANNTNNWQVEYGYAGFGQGEGTTISAATPSATIEGLTPNVAYDAYVRAVCGEGYGSTWSTKVTFTVTGISNVTDATQINLYPNPATGMTTISLSGVQGNLTLTIVDMSGRTVMTQTMECSGDCAKVLNVDNLSQGAYFVRVNG